MVSQVDRVPVLIITGTVGVGKTSVAGEISDLLSDARIPHAFVDIDALSNSWPQQGPFNQDLALLNLRAIWQNFRAAGAERLVISCVVESQEDVRAYERVIAGAEITICRLVASQSTRETRLRAREAGSGLEWHLNRTIELEEILERAALEDFRVENEGRSLQEVAREVLRRVGWV